jgi:hypothetical protein
MKIKGSYKLIYTSDKHQEELLVEVELKRLDELMKPHQNVYYGVAYVNGTLYLKKDISHYVDASCAAEEIGTELRDELKKKLRSEGKSFKAKKEEVK